jgi:hypothetical protein
MRVLLSIGIKAALDGSLDRELARERAAAPRSSKNSTASSAQPPTDGRMLALLRGQERHGERRASQAFTFGVLALYRPLGRTPSRSRPAAIGNVRRILHRWRAS